MIMKVLIILGILLSSLFSQEVVQQDRSQELKVKIEVLPATEVEVGDMVFFSGSKTEFSDKILLKMARYEWDFGDGTYFRWAPTDSRIRRSGICCAHYFMKPGEFEVKLTVSVFDSFEGSGVPKGAPIAKGEAIVKIKVTGEEPIKGFEIHRASFHCRMGQYLYIQIPSQFRGNETKLKVSLTGKNTNTKKTLIEKTNLSAEEKVLLKQIELPKDDYELIAELYDKEGKRIPGGIWKEKFTKHYEGMPKVGIDENNSIWVNGKLFFPIAGFFVSKSQLSDFKQKSNINCVVTTGYYREHNPDTFNDYLKNAEKYNLMVIGPHGGDYRVTEKEWIKYCPEVQVDRWKFNGVPERMIDYIRKNKNQPNLIAWSWLDEPNLGGRENKVYPPVLMGWTYICHKEDPDRPTMQLYVGEWSRYYGDNPRFFDYLATTEFRGEKETFYSGKRWITDILAFDQYPIAYRDHPSNNFSDMGPYAAYIDGLERLKRTNKNLVPILPCIITNKRRPPDPEWKVPTEEMVYMEGWMNVVHGAKGIIWFPHFVYDTIRWNAMKRFADQIEKLKEVILGPEIEREVQDDANEALKRVDTLIREKDGFLYIFAVRITEPDPVPEVKYQGKEPDSIEVNFEISGLSGEKEIEVIDENRKIKVVDGKFKDTFKKFEVHIYKVKI
ncbi:MAG: PKD domain-containing protein [bacterium]|nr:PKD domain-containing protein [bacterium]MDW8164854.1 PKD domain-containing protein [Candidatus Omnitrophota bacterium]